MPARSLPMPHAIKRKRDESRKDIDSIWPLILERLYEFPKTTDEKLWNLFGKNTTYSSLQSFKNAMIERGIVNFRKVINKKQSSVERKEASRQLTEQAAKSFEEERKEKGILFLQGMDKLVSQSATVIAKQGDMIEKLPEQKQAFALPSHMKNMEKLMSIGKDTYGLNKEATVEDRAKYQMNILLNYDPTKHVQSDDDVIEV